MNEVQVCVHMLPQLHVRDLHEQVGCVLRKALSENPQCVPQLHVRGLHEQIWLSVYVWHLCQPRSQFELYCARCQQRPTHHIPGKKGQCECPVVVLLGNSDWEGRCPLFTVCRL